MRNFIQIIILLVLAQSAVARDVADDLDYKRGYIETHNAIESASLRLTMDKNLYGFVEGKVCDFCETIRVNITPETKAYSNNVEVPLKRAEARIGRFATVIYELKTKNVSAIRW